MGKCIEGCKCERHSLKTRIKLSIAGMGRNPTIETRAKLSAAAKINQLGTQKALKHGHTANNQMSPTYISWKGMIQRCSNPNNPKYPRYGGRGITVCYRWQNFENFLADMGKRPSWANGGIDRIDNDGNYVPRNCRWATISMQQANK